MYGRKPVQEALDDPGLRRRLGCAARARVEERFGAAAMAERHQDLYERLLARARGD